MKNLCGHVCRLQSLTKTLVRHSIGIIWAFIHLQSAVAGAAGGSSAPVTKGEEDGLCVPQVLANAAIDLFENGLRNKENKVSAAIYASFDDGQRRAVNIACEDSGKRAASYSSIEISYETLSDGSQSILLILKPRPTKKLQNCLNANQLVASGLKPWERLEWTEVLHQQERKIARFSDDTFVRTMDPDPRNMLGECVWLVILTSKPLSVTVR